MGTENLFPVLSDAAREANFSNEGGAEYRFRFLKNIMGLWLIQESRRQWIREGENVSYADLEREALASAPFKCFIDCDAPEFAIAGDIPRRVQKFCEVTGQYVPKTRGEIMRCIYQSLAMKYKQNYNTICELSGKRFEQINMLGGGIKDTLLCRMTAAATGARVVAGPVEATVMGNIAEQMISLGEIADVKAARAIITASTPLAIYEAEGTEDFERYYPEFCKYLGKSGEQ